jgi:predicted SAM-dependent methyltransferase
MKMNRRLKFIIQNSLNGKSLDCGCTQNQNFHDNLVKLSNFKWFSVDKNPFYRGKKFRNSGFFICNVVHLSCRNEVFSNIFAGELIEHITEKNGIKFIDEIHRVLKTGGKLFITTPNKKSLMNRVIHNNEHIEHLHLYDFNELITKLTEHRFKCLEISGDFYDEKELLGNPKISGIYIGSDTIKIGEILKPIRFLLNKLLPLELREQIRIIAKKV